jgi:hypothetical protein
MVFIYIEIPEVIFKTERFPSIFKIFEIIPVPYDAHGINLGKSYDDLFMVCQFHSIYSKDFSGCDKRKKLQWR